VTALKIKYNPFAKAFLDKPNGNGRTCSPDYNNINNPNVMSGHQLQQQQQKQQLQQQNKFKLLDNVASLHNSHHQQQFHSDLPQHQQQTQHHHQQQYQNKFQLLHQVAALPNSQQFRSGLQHQHRHPQRYLPYNVQQRFHQNNNDYSQLPAGDNSLHVQGSTSMKEEPSPPYNTPNSATSTKTEPSSLYTPNCWVHSPSSSPVLPNEFLENYAFDSRWNRSGGAYFASPVTSSTVPGK
jgi:hypothetical protein